MNLAKGRKSVGSKCGFICLENSPGVIAHSPRLGLPVIGSNKGGIPELVEHQKNALLINPGDAESHRDTLETVLNNPSLLGTWRNSALSSTSKFAPDGLGVSLMNFIESVIQKNTSSKEIIAL
jgi:glycosyltransferase involved in cell wall biosynthesis